MLYRPYRRFVWWAEYPAWFGLTKAHQVEGGYWISVAGVLAD
jgi:hypothetical protein